MDHYVSECKSVVYSPKFDNSKPGSQGQDRNSAPYGSYVNIPPYSPYPNGSSPLFKKTPKVWLLRLMKNLKFEI
ncbi:hypothetical protein KUTeg_003818 [Tegillarca granosa]|uniref:Uncharacterized protein n=1 Tax=Tegillarca granosa TaxID=220873 RepID=A0ABQ9FN77_TEGGR|nr:hypothetical protein KUTeg_003818 [Tegillarca granosa]